MRSIRPPLIIGNCRFADDVLYDTEYNTWIKVQDSKATVGINSILAWMSGRFTSVSFKPVGTIVERGKSIGAVEGPKHFDTVKTPVSGRVVAINEALLTDPKLINSDPYSAGWFAEIEMVRPEEKALLKRPFSARAELEKKISEAHIRCFAEFPDREMYEIGTECAAVLVRLDETMATAPVGTVVHLVSDDTTAEIEMIGWCDRTGDELLETRKEGNLFHFIVKKKTRA